MNFDNLQLYPVLGTLSPQVCLGQGFSKIGTRSRQGDVCGFAGQKLTVVNRGTGEIIPVEVFVAILPIRHYTYIETCTTLFGADNNKITNDQGIADYVYQLAATGQVIRVSFYDADANLTEDELGIAEYFYKSDLNGLYFLDKQLNANGDEIPSEEI